MSTDSPSSVLVPPTSRVGLRRFSALLVAAVVALIAVGAQVTSHNAGMTVPDWPTSFGYNMYDLPFNRWLTVPGVFWEHSHRMLAGLIGVLSLTLAVWAGVREPRPWVRNLAFATLFLVSLQGVVGGVRVIQAWDQIGILHGTLAQLCLVATGLIFLSYTKNWNAQPPFAERLPRQWQRGIHLLVGLVFCQLILGAIMRHQHAGLSIPDFPTAYRHLWPHITPERLAGINANRLAHHMPPTTVTQINLQMVHRAVALVLFLGIYVVGLDILRCRQSPPHLRKLALGWIVLVSLQIVLGACVVLTGKNPVIASAHVLNGALILLTGSHMAALVSKWRRFSKEPALAPASPAA